MAYATQADLEALFGVSELAELTDRVNGEVVDADVVTRALNAACAEIDGYLAGRYQLPLATVPEILVRLNYDMARYYLYADGATETVRNRYTDAVRLLRAIGSGDAKLAGGEALAPSRQGNEAMVTAPSRPTAFRGNR